MEKYLTKQELATNLEKAAKHVTIGATYRHYKDKNYTVLNLAITEADNEVCVIYQAQYGERLIFSRPLKSWLETVEWQDKTVERFRKAN